LAGYFFYIYESPKKTWRWRFIGPRGAIVAVSGVGYAEREECVAAAERLTDETLAPTIRYAGT